MALALTEDFRQIVLENRPLLDVRAPIEFAKGAFPHAVNLPIMTDEERHLIGIRYKNNGNEAAVALGQELIDGTPRKERTEGWKTFIAKHPDAYLYCFRGGQRSRIAQEWLAQESIMIERLKGGYKAFRHFLMQESLRVAQEAHVIVIGGRTGGGKTLLLNTLKESIDLEGLSNHRGSSFGYHLTPQPTQIDFENALAYALIQHEAKAYPYLIIEHESRNIGMLNIPKETFNTLQHNATFVLLETPIDKRVEITYEEYVTQAQARYHEHFAEEGEAQWFEDVKASLMRIQKRLGLERYQAIFKTFEQAHHDNNPQGHKVWIKQLLVDYYDPMYDYQIDKSSMSVQFRGNDEELIAYLRNLR